ncbi:MAG: SDR family NAD(P)-dependent oxidoreductase [bacterium]
MRTGGPAETAAASLTVLVPALNEQDALESTIRTVLRSLGTTIEDFEILIVDDGSTDRTAEIADRLAAAHPQIRSVHNARNMGLGYSYLRGVELASKRYFVYVPADDTWPTGSLVDVFGNIGRSDVVTSYVTSPHARSISRQLVSRWYTRALNLLFGRRLHYYNGLTIFPIAFLRSRQITTYGFGFQAEALLKALDRGFSLVEIPVPATERAAGGSRALRLKNIVSVAATVARLFWDLRVARRGRRTGHQAPETGGGAAGPLRILITGASAGIGAGLLEALARDGHTLFACARRGPALDEATRHNTLARGRLCDVSDEQQVREFIAWLESVTDRLDVLINCAGTIGAIGPVELADSDEWWGTLRVNLFGTYAMTRHALPLLQRSEDGRILNFAGGGAFGPRLNYSAYACSKAAVVRLTECLAAELAPVNIAVNAVAPGFVATGHHRPTIEAGVERAGALAYRRTKEAMEQDAAPQIDKVADCVRRLLAPDLRGLTGKTISVNFDPWRSGRFREYCAEITRSDLYALRRINIVNLPDGALKQALQDASAEPET